MINRKDVQNIESLFMLAAVHEHSSKRKAAQSIGSSVDTLNKYINNLEAELGVQLVISSGLGCQLTPKGRNVVSSASEIKEILMKIYADKPENNTASGLVKVGMDIGVSANCILYRIDKFFTRYPKVQIQTMMFQDSLKLCYNDLDIGISYSEPREKDVVSLAVKQIECKLFASPQYLSENGYPQDIEDIIQNHRIVCKSGMSYYDKEYREILKKAEKVCYISNSSGSVIDAVKNNAGICIMPTRFADEGLVCLDNFNKICHISLYLSCHKKTKDLPRVRAVINYLKEVFEKM